MRLIRKSASCAAELTVFVATLLTGNRLTAQQKNAL